MTLFKIPFRNVRRSMRDYAIYFFTLIIGISIFYVFNAIGGQAAMMRVSSSRNDIVRLLQTTISWVSVFVAVILALLIVYASRFLMKRRNREFALYMLLGMSKGRISAILLMETLLIGFCSLAAGLVLGIGLSQLMSALVANLFEADMADYQLTVSGHAAGMTVLFFAVMYAVVMIFNSAAVTRMKLIDLIQSGRKSEQIRAKNPWLCILVFLLASAGLGWAYVQVGWNYEKLDEKNLVLYILVGALATFFLFWSVAGLLLRIVSRMKNVYYRGLNAFTFRQVSSKISTMVFSMTLICLMLFVTICALTSAFSVRNSFNANLKALCPADAQMGFSIDAADEKGGSFQGLSGLYADCGYDITDGYREYVEFQIYRDEDYTLAAALGTHLEKIRESYPFLDVNSPEKFVRISDYNMLMRLYGREPMTLSDDEFILLCDFKSMKTVRDEALEQGTEIHVFGKVLRSKYGECQDGFINLAAQHLNEGVFLVPDDAVGEKEAKWEDCFTGNYASDNKAETEKIETMQRERWEKVTATFGKEHEGTAYSYWFNSRLDIYDAATGLGAILAFLGLYIGLVFLIACGAILALKELSESVDSLPNYETLRKIGVEEKDLSRSLFRQTGIFFLLPLLLAVVHSVVGMRLATRIMESFGTEAIGESVGLTSVILLLIYGGYFLITFQNSRWIIRGRNSSL